jgi:hypothetical protein
MNSCANHYLQANIEKTLYYTGGNGSPWKTPEASCSEYDA